MRLIIPDWRAPENINAFTSSRRDGVSVGVYNSLNVGDHVEDDPIKVECNRETLITAVREQYDIDLADSFEPQWLNQRHTTIIRTNDQSTPQEVMSECDGQYTQSKGVVCTVMTADCMPVFICNQTGTEVALVHAGWRGLADGIVEKAIQLFSDKSADLMVHCGPAISQKNFEIGNDVKAMLGGSEKFYLNNSKRKGHCYADLTGLLGERVNSLGADFSYSEFCTFSDEELFYSYRRDGVTGRMVSMIWMS